MKSITERKCLNCGETKAIELFRNGLWISTWCDRCRNPLKKSRKRYAAIKANGGKVTEDEWNELCQRYGNRCLCCGRSGVKLTKDHVVPVALGGPTVITNIQPLCQSCNSKKHTKVIDYR